MVSLYKRTKIVILCLYCSTTIALQWSLQRYNFPRTLLHSFSTSNKADDENYFVGTIPNDDDYNTDPSICPFRSRYYPRMVPIPFRKRRKKELDIQMNKIFWLPGQRSYIRSRYVQQQQQTYGKASTAAYNVEWMENMLAVEVPSPTLQFKNIITLAALWDIVGNVTTAHVQHQQTTTGSTMHDTAYPNGTITSIIALPNLEGYIVEQFVNMIQWMFERQQQHHNASHTLFVSYSNTIVDFMSIPTIILTLPVDSQTSVSRQATEQSTQNDNEQPSYNHEIISKRTKSWVQRMLVDTTICPFTKSVMYSGQGLSDVNVPVGKIAYHTSSSTPSPPTIVVDAAACSESQPHVSSYLSIVSSVCKLQSDTLLAIHDMLQAGPTYSMKNKLNGISSILLAAPGWDDHFELWTSTIFPILEVSVQLLDLTEQIGIVCFHPYYQTPDGRSFPGFGHMHSVPRLQQWLSDHKPHADIQTTIENSISDLMKSKIISDPTMIHDHDGNQIIVSAIACAGGAWQRRTPHATINVLRANQLAAAESKRSTPTLYTTNILRLSRIGWSQLQQLFNDERNIK